MSHSRGIQPDGRLFGVDIPKCRYIPLEKYNRKLMAPIDFDPGREVPLRRADHSYLSLFFPVKELLPGGGRNCRSGFGSGYQDYPNGVRTLPDGGFLRFRGGRPGSYPLLFELLGFDTPGARMISDTETWYSWGNICASCLSSSSILGRASCF